MRIDNGHGSQIYSALGKAAAAGAGQTPKGAQAPKADAQAVVISGLEQRYVGLARGAQRVDAAAVAEARRMLGSGELDTPEAAQRAAEAILGLGI